MAIIKPGHVGVFNGRIGHVVVSKWRQLIVGRSTPGKRTKKATEIQLDQQSKFGLVTSFISCMARIVSLGYKDSLGNLTPYSAAVQYHLAKAVIGEYPEYELDFSKVKLTAPKASAIDGVLAATASAAVNSKIYITWETTSTSLNTVSKTTDELCVVFYNATEEGIMTYDGITIRSALTVPGLRLPLENPDDVIHCWIFFMSADRKLVSKSKYLGIIDLTPA